MALLKLYRGKAAPALETGKIWFDSANQVIKVCTTTTPAEGTDGWEPYGLSEAEIAALILAAKTEVLGTLEADDAATLKALNEEIDALQAKLAALAAKTVTINEKATGHVTVSKTVDAQGATVYTVAESDIASAKGLADEIKRATGEEARIEGLVTAEAARAAEAEGKLADRLDVIEGEAEGSIKKALADAKAYTDEAKAAIEGELADTDAKTLAALNDRIDTVVADAKTYEIVKVETGLEANVKEQYQLVQKVGKTSENVGAAIKIYKDSALQSAVLGTATVDGVEQDCLILTYLDVNGASQVVNIPVGDFLRESEFGNGLVINGGVVSVGVREADADFVVAEADQLNFAGAKKLITDGDAATLAAAKQYTNDAIAALDITVDSTSTIAEYAGEKDAEDTTPKIAIQLVEEDGKIKSIAVTETDIASAKMVHDHEKVVSAALNDLNARIEGHDDRIEALEAGLGAVEHTTVSDGDTADFVAITETTEGSHKNYAVSATVVKGANGDDAGLATDAYVREQIAAAAMVWEEGSF